MSEPEVMEDTEPMDTTALSGQQTAVRKSYRRKYRKIMVTFEEKMRESTSLFKEEQRIFDVSQRLAEQTDQLLQLLVDLNSFPQIPQRLRYDLTPPGTIKPELQPSGAAGDDEEGHLALRKARKDISTGHIRAASYREIETNLLQTPEFAPGKSYAELVKSIPVRATRSADRGDGDGVAVNGFLTSKDEEQYLQGLDAFLDGTAPTARPHAANNLGKRHAEKTVEREREMQLKNPVSVYNWLRKHQPQVFLQDNETGTERVPRSAGVRSSKRTRDSAVKREVDLDDDEAVIADVGTGRGKRKRVDDAGYRPRGGNSAKKRPKEASGGKRTKKASLGGR